jgi:putative FmdB family regulatory protein
MPTYDYECQTCNYGFEAFQSMSDEPLSVCPKCSGTVKRVIGGGSGIIFKGTGFYVNDSKKSSSSTGTKKETVGSKK